MWMSLEAASLRDINIKARWYRVPNQLTCGQALFSFRLVNPFLRKSDRPCERSSQVTNQRAVVGSYANKLQISVNRQ